MAAHQEKARRQHARIVLIDESGLLMAPLVRRTWAPRGRTPELVQQSGTREKVSVLAALCLSPRRDRLDLYFQTLVDDYFDNWYVATFLDAMLQSLAGRFVVIWDGGSMHKGDPITRLQDIRADRLCWERFPPYSPQLCPIEPLWSWLQYSRLCNFAPEGAVQLDGCVVAELAAIRGDQELLRGFWHASDLPLPRTLLS